MDMLQQFKGTVLENGYGLIGKKVMRDKKLHYCAKSIYCYLLTYGNSAFPSRELICTDLNITKDTFTKHLSALKELGYITVTQIKEKGQFKHNLYVIESVPVPCPKKQDTAKTPCPNSSDTKKPDTKIYDTNSTNLNSTSLNNTTTTKDEETVVVASLEIENVGNGYKDVALTKTINEQLVVQAVDDGEQTITELMELLVASGIVGVSRASMKTWVSLKGVAYLRQAIEFVGGRISNKKIRNVAGFLRDVVTTDKYVLDVPVVVAVQDTEIIAKDNNDLLEQMTKQLELEAEERNKNIKTEFKIGRRR